VRLPVLIVGVLLVGGCSVVAPDVSPPAGASTTSSAPAPAEAPDPWSVTIPKIGAHSTLVPLGLNDKSELEVPPLDQPGQAGWYAGADPVFDGDEHKPGEPGPAVIAGHVDGYGPDGRKGFPGVFHRLSELAPGDEVLVDLADASRLRFVVTGVQKVAKDSFPSEQVYGPTTQPELRLITCGGDFDRASGHYVDNWVVFAALAT
jgi:sortase (surface protein transpeptidase)